jgi:hypothetical protein
MEHPKNDRDFADGQPIGLPFGKALGYQAAADAKPAKSGRLKKALWLVAALWLGSLVYLTAGATGLIVLACAAGALLVAAIGWGMWVMNNVRM